MIIHVIFAFFHLLTYVSIINASAELLIFICVSLILWLSIISVFNVTISLFLLFHAYIYPIFLFADDDTSLSPTFTFFFVPIPVLLLIYRPISVSTYRVPSPLASFQTFF